MQLIDAVDAWVVAKNRDGEYILSNRQHAKQAHGLTVDELLGITDLESFETDVEEDKIRGDDLEVMDTGEPITVPQERLTGDDGIEYVLRTVKLPFETEMTQQDATFGVARDIGGQVDSEKLLALLESNQDLMQASTAQEVGAIAVNTITTVLDLDYCTVWERSQEADRLELVEWSDAVADHASVTDLGSVTAGHGESQWKRFTHEEGAVETEMAERVEADDLPVDEPLTSLIVLPIGDYGLPEVGSFEQDIFKDNLVKILALNMETAFGRLERERELREITRRVEKTVVDVVGETEDVAETSQDISEQAQRQVESMVSTSDEETTMSATLDEIASTTDKVEETSRRAADLADEGRDSAQATKEVIDDVTTSAERVIDDVESLENHVEETDTIVDVINDIAEQTNILALNASIEAAGADESGDAFEIVASEVKELAGESQDNAADIESLIDNVQRNTAETVESLQEMVVLVEQGYGRVEESLENLEGITDVVEDASAGIAEVSRALDDQASSTEEVATQVEESTGIADDVADRIEEVADANEAIDRKVSDLRTSVAELTANR